MSAKNPKRTPKRLKKSNFVISEVPTVDTPNFTMNWTDLKSRLPVSELVVKRVYWINNIKGEGVSGQHFHKDDEDEIFIVLSGKGTAIIDKGDGIQDISLKQNSIMWVPRLVWHGFKKMSKDFCILALTTTVYDTERKGYVTDHHEFRKLSNNK